MHIITLFQLLSYLKKIRILIHSSKRRCIRTLNLFI
nr:MAG TPA: hypothetical protein [Caudoviricetes sp.]